MAQRRFRPDYQSDLARYYQDELRYLKDLGAEHAKDDPSRAHFEFGAIEDPDVLLLLKGFSFLTAKIRQRLDDGVPEISHSLISLLFPHFLRSVPSLSVVEFSPKGGALQTRTTIARGTQLDAQPVGDEVCRFQTCFDTDVLPLAIDRLRLERGDGRGGALKLSLRAAGPVDLASLDLSRLRLFLRDGREADRATTLLWLLCEHVDDLSVEWTVDGTTETRRRSLDARSSIRHVGLDDTDQETSLLPYPDRSFDGFRLLQEYFALASKFQFLDVLLGGDPETGQIFGDDGKVPAFDLVFQIGELPTGLPQIDEGMLALHCTPVVNLYAHDTDPLVLDHSRTEYVLRPRDGERQRREIWSVEGVTAIEPSRRPIENFYSFHSSATPDRDSAIFYEACLRPALFGPDDEAADRVVDRPTTDTYLRFVTLGGEQADPSLPVGPNPASALPVAEKISVDVYCTDRLLPLKLKPSDISVPTDGLHLGVTFRGIEPITPTVAPPMGHDVHWKLLSHLALNRVSLTTVDRLRGLLEIYDSTARVSPAALRDSRRRLDALQAIDVRLGRAFHRGAPVRVVETVLDVRDDGFKGVGEVYVFGKVLSAFLSQYVAANCLSRLTIELRSSGRTIRFGTRAGTEVFA